MFLPFSFAFIDYRPRAAAIILTPLLTQTLSALLA
jgi:hypothetical protein